MIWTNILYGAVGAAVYGAAGAANKPSKESLDFTKYGITVVIGAAVGVIAYFTGMEYGVVADMSIAAGFTVIVEKLWKAMYRNYFA